MRANKISLLAIALVVATASYAWKPAGTKIMTKWGRRLLQKMYYQNIQDLSLRGRHG